MQDLFNELLVRELQRQLAPGVSLEQVESELAWVQERLTPARVNTLVDQAPNDADAQPPLSGFFREYSRLDDDALQQIAPEVHEWLLHRLPVRLWTLTNRELVNEHGEFVVIDTLDTLGRLYRLYANSTVAYTVMGVLLEIDDAEQPSAELAAARAWRTRNSRGEFEFPLNVPMPREVSEDILAYVDMLPGPVEVALMELRSSVYGEASFELDRNLQRWSERLGGAESDLIQRVLRI